MSEPPKRGRPKKEPRVKAPKKSGIEKVVEKVGSQHELARQLNVSQQAVYQWVTRGFVPNNRIAEIERRYEIDAAELIDPEVLKLLKLPDNGE